MASALYYVTVCVVMIFTVRSAGAARSSQGDDIDLRMRTGFMIKMLREMANQTNATTADTLNLPANASSIRENITDTFSCENRTYGYYADVDNDCQVFHVCLPSQTPSGRNVTYKWSFICPNETIFNQDVMVCTRPIDSIDCADSPMYYDRNDEFGKVNYTMSESSSNDTTSTGNTSNNNSNMKRKGNNYRKQNIVMMNKLVMNRDTDEMMKANDGEMENMMMDSDKTKRKDAKRKQNTIMAEHMTMTEDENAIVIGDNMAGGTNKNDQNPHMPMSQNGMREVNYMTESIRKENNDRISLNEETQHQKVHQVPIMTNDQKTEQKDTEAVSDYGAYYQGQVVEDPIDVANERMALERNFKRTGKRLKRRGSFRFKADV